MIIDIVEVGYNKESDNYRYDVCRFHFFSAYRCTELLAKKWNAVIGVVELAPWLNAFMSILYGCKDCYSAGVEVAEKKLSEFGCPKEKIEKTKHYLLIHCGLLREKRDTVAAQIVADIDALSNFDAINGLFKVAYVNEKRDRGDAQRSTRQKLVDTLNKVSSEVREVADLSTEPPCYCYNECQSTFQKN